MDNLVQVQTGVIIRSTINLIYVSIVVCLIIYVLMNHKRTKNLLILKQISSVFWRHYDDYKSVRFLSSMLV